MKRRAIFLSQILVLAALACAVPYGAATPQTSASPSAQAAAPSKPVTGSDLDDLRNPSPKIRAKAAQEIGETGDPSAVPALISALNDSSPRVRKQVVVALASIR
ncbi:MAG TPA: HEAT repeat domain-containing protein, partial [Terriglobia bacterium]|nr:HEAT repeat domain-containing protein [Terriglobia bacterium]